MNLLIKSYFHAALGCLMLVACGGSHSDKPAKPRPFPERKDSKPPRSFPERKDPKPPRPISLPNPGPHRSPNLGLTLMVNGESGLPQNLEVQRIALQDTSAQWHGVRMATAPLHFPTPGQESLMLIHRERLPFGQYQALRFTLTTPGLPHTGPVASSHLVLPLHPPLAVAVHPSVSACLMLDLETSMDAGSSTGAQRFRPGLSRCLETAASATVTGRVEASPSGEPLAGVRVTAQSLEPGPGLDSDGGPGLIRVTRSDASGRFTLDRLPPGPTLVLAQPKLGEQVLDSGTAAVVLKPGVAEEVNLACPAAVHTGALVGSLPTPLAEGHGLLVDLIQLPETGGEPRVLRRCPLAPGDSEYRFEHLPSGAYRLRISHLSGSKRLANARSWIETEPFPVQSGLNRKDFDPAGLPPI